MLRFCVELPPNLYRNAAAVRSFAPLATAASVASTPAFTCCVAQKLRRFNTLILSLSWQTQDSRTETQRGSVFFSSCKSERASKQAGRQAGTTPRRRARSPASQSPGPWPPRALSISHSNAIITVFVPYDACSCRFPKLVLVKVMRADFE